MNKRGMTVLLALVFLVGLGLLLYPTIANYWNERNQMRIIAIYNQEAAAEQAARNEQMIADAQAFNQRLAEKGSLSILSEEETQTYASLLNMNGDGVMGYIEIPKIDVQLSIAHTVEEDVLQRMVGHLPGTSLPVEGENVHAVVSAHRGLPSATLFSNLDQLAVGDTFTLYVVDRTYTYLVDDVTVILPEEVEHLNIIEGKNYVTLMTCTPYGVNTHRLLVRGELVDTPATPDEAEQVAAPQAPFYVRYRDEMVLGTAGVMVIVFLTLLIRRRGGKR